VTRCVGEFSVRVPASTSNLGAGFDAVGMAVDRWLNVDARITSRSEAVVLERAGTLAVLDCADEDDLIWRGFNVACAALRRTPPTGVEISATSDIPVGRGLGSSAAAIVAGVLLANAMLDGDLDATSIVNVAASIDGHPDNVAPSMLGGAVLSVRTSGHHYSSAPIVVHPSLRFVFLVPDFEVRTSVARAALPATLPYATAVSAVGRAAALILGLQTADASILAPALDDVLHVPFRRSLIPAYDDVASTAIAAGAIGATLSGSGSTIVAVARHDVADRVRDVSLNTWRSAGVSAEAFITAAEPRGAMVDEMRVAGGQSRP